MIGEETISRPYKSDKTINKVQHFKGYPVDILRDGCATKLLITFHIFRQMKMYANTCKYDYCSSKLS